MAHRAGRGMLVSPLATRERMSVGVGALGQS